MSRESVADALDRAAEAIAQAAHELRGTEQPAAGVVPPSAPAPAAHAQSTALGRCPKHGVPWKAMPPGTSKNGNPYPAFWKCPEKDESEPRGYCNQKPDRGWAATHRPEATLTAEEPPF